MAAADAVDLPAVCSGDSHARGGPAVPALRLPRGHVTDRRRGTSTTRLSSRRRCPDQETMPNTMTASLVAIVVELQDPTGRRWQTAIDLLLEAGRTDGKYNS